MVHYIAAAEATFDRASKSLRTVFYFMLHRRYYHSPPDVTAIIKNNSIIFDVGRPAHVP